MVYIVVVSSTREFTVNFLAEKIVFVKCNCLFSNDHKCLSHPLRKIFLMGSSRPLFTWHRDFNLGWLQLKLHLKLCLRLLLSHSKVRKSYQMIRWSSKGGPDDVASGPDRRRTTVRHGVNVCTVTQQGLHDGQPAGNGRGPQWRHRVADAFIRHIEEASLWTKLISYLFVISQWLSRPSTHLTRVLVLT